MRQTTDQAGRQRLACRRRRLEQQPLFHSDQDQPHNVKSLGGAWVKKFEGAYSRITPVVADGMMFVTAGPYVYALNPRPRRI